MSWTRVLANRVRGIFFRSQSNRELEDEVRFHLAMQADDNLQAGMSPSEARYAAMRSFGAIEPMKERYRDRRTFAFVETIAQDVRYALRTLRKNPGFTLTSVLVLAVAIGANTAMFSVLHAILLRPLPYRSPEQLTVLWSELPSQNLREGRSAYWNIEQWRQQSETFADIAFFDGLSATLTTADGAEQISVVRHSPNFFPLLGVEPLYGRLFSEQEAEQRQRLALVSHRFWQARFGGSYDAIGAMITIDGIPSQIIGILPPDFHFLNDTNTDVWEPHTMFRDWELYRQARGSGFWSVIGRLRPDVSVAQAQAEMTAIARRLDEEMPLTDRKRGISVTPFTVQVAGQNVRLALWMLAGAVFCVLLIAASNVASLSLARSARREREIAVRAALGASRGRIVRQMIIESLTLATLSGVAGLLVAVAGIRLILAVKPWKLARLDEVSLDPVVLGWAMALCLFTGILVGLAPAIRMARRNLVPSGQEGGRSIAGGAFTRRTRGILVVAEFALAILLLVGAGLLVRSLWFIENVDLGFKPQRVSTMQLSTTTLQSAPQRANFYSSVLQQIQTLPGVESAGVIGDFFVAGNPERIVTVEGHARSESERIRLRSDEVSPEFFRTVGAPLLRGRFFSVADGPEAPRVAIINDMMAHRLWPGIDPVGKRFKVGAADSASPWYTVVGIVGDMRRQGLEKVPLPQMFEPLAQNPSRLATLLIRTASDDPLTILGAVEAAVRRVEKHVPLYDVNTLENRLGTFLTERRFQTALLMGFSVIALLMAAIGIYGLIQYSIATRTHEIGIRMAVGAQAGEIFRMVIREGLQLSLTGLAIGLVGALWLGRLGSSLLFGVSASDPLTLATVSLLLTIVAVAACYFPARRAMKVEPVVALRQE